MRTLSEIIEDCKLNKKPSIDELRYSVIVLTSLTNMASGVLMRFYNADEKSIEKIRIENIFKGYSTALNKSPKEWLGWVNDPENPEYQSFHAMGTKLVEKALRGELPNQKKTESEARKC